MVSTQATRVNIFCVTDNLAEAKEERNRAEELRLELDQLAIQEGKLPPEQQRLLDQLGQQRSLVIQREQRTPQTAQMCHIPSCLLPISNVCALCFACLICCCFMVGCMQLLSSKDQKLAELQKGANTYKRHLGLTFERVGGAAPPSNCPLSPCLPSLQGYRTATLMPEKFDGVASHNKGVSVSSHTPLCVSGRALQMNA